MMESSTLKAVALKEQDVEQVGEQVATSYFVPGLESKALRSCCHPAAVGGGSHDAR